MAYRPSPRHNLMLRAALGDPERAESAWRAWRRDHVVYDADPEETRLLPIVAARISAVVQDDPELLRLHGQRRHAWTLNLMRATRCAETADGLYLAGIESLFFKGIGMLPFYSDRSMRSMSDADILVPWHLRHEAIDYLNSVGFQPVHRLSLADMHRTDQRYPGYGMRRSDGIEADLHWRPLHHLRPTPHLDAPLFTNSIMVTVGSATIRVPHPSHHAVLAIGHGMRSDSNAHLIAVADTCQLMAAHGFEPTRMVQLARDYERIEAVRDTCMIIEELFRDGSCDELIGVAETAQGVRQMLPRGSLGGRLLDRQLTTTSNQLRDEHLGPHAVWTAVTDTPLKQGGPIAGLAEIARRATNVEHARDVPGQLIWLAGRRAATVGRFRHSPAETAETPPLVPVGSVITPTLDGERQPIFRSGWYPAERGHAWSRPPEASLAFRTDLPPRGGCTLAIAAFAFVSSDHGRMVVDVRIKGRRRAVWTFPWGVDVDRIQRITLTNDDLGPDNLCEVLFVVRGATSPFREGLGSDRRLLGIAVESIALEPAGSAPALATAVESEI